MQDAGFDPKNVPGRVGVVVCGGTFSHYGSEVLGVDLDTCRTEKPDEYFALEIGTDKDRGGGGGVVAPNTGDPNRACYWLRCCLTR